MQRCLVLDIIFKLTASRKSFIKSSRVKALLKLKQKDPENPQLITLLSRMQDLRPDLVKIKVGKIRKSSRSLIGRMEKTFALVWANYHAQGENSQSDSLDIPLEICRSKEDLSNKRTRKHLIPPISLEPEAKRQKMVSFYECETLRDLVKNLVNICPPSQALSLLGSPHTMYLLFLTNEPREMQERLSITLSYILHNEFFSMSRSKVQSQRKLDLLCRINQLQDYFQHGLPVVGRFLTQYLAFWDGEEFFIEICKMLSNLQLSENVGKILSFSKSCK